MSIVAIGVVAVGSLAGIAVLLLGCKRSQKNSERRAVQSLIEADADNAARNLLATAKRAKKAVVSNPFAPKKVVHVINNTSGDGDLAIWGLIVIDEDGPIRIWVQASGGLLQSQYAFVHRIVDLISESKSAKYIECKPHYPVFQPVGIPIANHGVRHVRIPG